MEFWGVEVKPGQSLKCVPGEEKYIHLSQAAIGETKKGKGSQSIPLFVNFEGKKLVIGTLSSESCQQISYDLVFEKEFELSHNWKEGSVYFTGYKTVVAEDEVEDFSDEDSESEDLEAVPINEPANGKAPAKQEKPAAAAKTKGDASKAQAKPSEPAKVESEDDEDDDDASDDGDSDEEMGEGEDDSDCDEEGDEDDSSEEEEEVKVTPKKPESGKKRAAAASDTKSPAPVKKAKLVTPTGKNGSHEGKKSGHAATPYPNKQAAKTAKPQTPKSAGSVSCTSCSKTFNSDGALQSHTKAKHVK